ncbi:hypothetical protein GCM10010252_66800 [Streptomyces aureoverticillatus]|nr:hypothetical protein GCM10010252_66800 [Streptomyces aureoverticillatus]
MTGELDELAEWLSPPAARCVLFDFDGPLCRLFPDRASDRVARDLKALAAGHGVRDVLTDEEESSIDPHVVLRAMDRAGVGAVLVRELEARLTRGELRAVPGALPTPDAGKLVRALRAAGCGIAVVTNNSARAAAAFLDRPDVGLADAFGPHIHGRTHRPDLLKPDPDVVSRALLGLDAKPGDALLIGDTVTDLEAARAAGVGFFVGYARNEDKARPLRAAGAPVVVDSLLPLLDLVSVASA